MLHTDGYPQEKITFTGGGIIAALELYYLLLSAKQKQEPVRVSVYEKNKTLGETTTCNNFPSLTFNEIGSVVPFGELLIQKLKLLFSQPGGIRVDDVPGVNNSAANRKFKAAVLAYSRDKAAHQSRVDTLFEAGKLSMQFWQEMYDSADAELKWIFRKSNYNPCRELEAGAVKTLHQGYRIDPIFAVADGMRTAEEMRDEYQQLGAHQSCVLTPQQVMDIDPYLSDFCRAHSERNTQGELVWKRDAAAVWRPGGCLDTRVFLPLFFEYLQKQFGTYTNDKGEVKDCLRFKFDRRVAHVLFQPARNNAVRIAGLHFFNSQGHDGYRFSKYQKDNYVFCPGEKVGTLQALGFQEPAYAGFAGPSLALRIPLNAKQVEEFGQLNHCMEVQQEGVVLAWQARMLNGCLQIGVAGTKAYYSDKKPENSHAFALNRHVLQLNIINNMLPRVVSIALGRDTTGETLTLQDLEILERRGIAVSWVGVRAVFFDGGPVVGRLYAGKYEVENARATTGAGSGGVSFAPVLVKASRRVDEKHEPDAVMDKLVGDCDSRRKARR